MFVPRKLPGALDLVGKEGSQIPAAIEKPHVTVIIPTTCERSRAEALKRAIRSVQEQEGVSLRLVVVVNGNLVERELLSDLQSDSSIEVHRLEEPNQAAAQRYGRSLVEDEFFAFLDDDDEYLPGALEMRIQPMLENQALDVVATNGFSHADGADSIFYQNPRHFQENFLSAVLTRGNWLFSGGVAFRAARVHVDYFDARMRYYEWTLLAFRLALDNLGILFIDTPTFRQHSTPNSLSKSEGYAVARIDLIDEILRYKLPPHLSSLMRRKRARVLHSLCAYYRVRGNFDRAWHYHRACIRSGYGLRYLPYGFLLFLRITRSRQAPDFRLTRSEPPEPCSAQPS